MDSATPDAEKIIKRSMPDANSPADMMNEIAARRHTRGNNVVRPSTVEAHPPAPLDPPQVSSSPPVQTEPAAQVEPAEPAEPPQEGEDFTPNVEESLESLSDNAPEEGIEDETEAKRVEEVKTKEENFKALRTKFTETNLKLEGKDKEVVKLEKKLKEYETGAAIPEIIQAKENEIAKLSGFQKIHNLKLSPEYTEKFVEPLDKLTTQLSEYAADYEIPKEKLEEALNFESTAELNRFLSNHFDDVGALEVKQIVNDMKSIQAEARLAEEAPAAALEALQAEHAVITQKRESDRISSISTNSKSAWVDSLTELQEEGSLPELTFNPNDSEHNEKYVKPIVQRAATEYGKIVGELARLGLTELPKDLAKALSRMTQLAHASSVASQSRNEATRQLNEVLESSDRSNGYDRPRIGSSQVSSSDSPPAPRQRMTHNEAAQGVINKVL